MIQHSAQVHGGRFSSRGAIRQWDKLHMPGVRPEARGPAGVNAKARPFEAAASGLSPEAGRIQFSMKSRLEK